MIWNEKLKLVAVLCSADTFDTFSSSNQLFPFAACPRTSSKFIWQLLSSYFVKYIWQLLSSYFIKYIWKLLSSYFEKYIWQLLSTCFATKFFLDVYFDKWTMIISDNFCPHILQHCIDVYFDHWSMNISDHFYILLFLGWWRNIG